MRVLPVKYVCLCFDAEADVEGLDVVALAEAAYGTYGIRITEILCGSRHQGWLHFKQELTLPCVCICMIHIFCKKKKKKEKKK